MCIYTIFCLLHCSYITRGRDLSSVPLETCLTLPVDKDFLRFFILILPGPLFFKSQSQQLYKQKGGGGMTYHREWGYLYVCLFVSLTSRHFQKHVDISLSSGLVCSGRRAIFCGRLLSIDSYSFIPVLYQFKHITLLS